MEGAGAPQCKQSASLLCNLLVLSRMSNWIRDKLSWSEGDVNRNVKWVQILQSFNDRFTWRANPQIDWSRDKTSTKRQSSKRIHTNETSKWRPGQNEPIRNPTVPWNANIALWHNFPRAAVMFAASIMVISWKRIVVCRCYIPSETNHRDRLSVKHR